MTTGAWNLDSEYQDGLIEEVRAESKGHYVVTVDGWSLGWECDFVPQVGDRARYFGKGVGFSVRGVVCFPNQGGMPLVVRYQSADDAEIERQEWLKNYERECAERTGFPIEGDAMSAQTKTDDGAGLIHHVASPFAETKPRPNMVSGDASKGDIEIRFDPPDAHNISAIDEIVAREAHVHLERMDKGQWALIIDAKAQRACFMINGKDVARSVVTTQVFWLDQIGRAPAASAERADGTRRSAAPSSTHERRKETR